MLRLLILLAVPICLFEGIPLIRQKKWKELIVFSVLIVAAFGVVIAKTIGLPTPLELLDSLVHPVGQAIFRRF